MSFPREHGVCPGSETYFCTPSGRARRLLFYLITCGHFYTGSSLLLAEDSEQIPLHPPVQAHLRLHPHEFLILTRLNRAKHLLTTTDLPISQVAREVGYRSVTTFSNAFADRVGLSPTRFRQYPL